jgi:2-keto-4-pentenoate hydratase/2-oxohepta-3-ene-1,7-dioic acid hydratase in catechol pathway
VHLYTTTRGIARGGGDDEVELLDVPYRDLGEALRGGDLDEVRGAPVKEEATLADLELLAPVLRPGKVVIVGLNYRSHADEVLETMAAMGVEPPDASAMEDPTWFILPGSAVVGPNQAIRLPAVHPNMVDYEGEIAVVIGAAASSVRVEDAWRHVAGLSVCNDVTARDLQLVAMRGAGPVTVAHAKCFDTFKPLGPALVTADGFAEPLELRLRTWVNGELRQDATTGELLHQVSDIIAHVSARTTHEPGDVISTGSPRGAGVFNGGVFLAPGDIVEVEVGGVGRLVNPVVGVPPS